MEDDEIQRIHTLQQSMEEFGRVWFLESDIQHLRDLVRLTVEFYDYLTSTPPRPQFPDDPFHDLTYKAEAILINVESFCAVTRAYGVLVGATSSTIDWNKTNIGILRERFTSLYTLFVAQKDFETKCRLLLDLVKLQIVLVRQRLRVLERRGQTARLFWEKGTDAFAPVQTASSGEREILRLHDGRFYKTGTG